MQEASRRSFFRVALAVPAISAGWAEATQIAPVSAGASVVSRIELDRAIYDSGTVITGKISFRLPASKSVAARWIDSLGRIVAEARLKPSASGVAPLSFSFDTACGTTYRNWVRVLVDGAEQAETAQFLLSPAPEPWDDFHVISWAHYRNGFYDLLRKSGVDGTIAYRDDDFSAPVDNDFKFYVEQMAWEVFSIYHKDQPLWRGLLAQIASDRNNLDLWVRKPCVNDPKTDAYVRKHLTHYVRQHRAFRPLFYNIADELGQGDQIRPNDFCHSDYCITGFSEYLRKLYGTPGSVGEEWSVGGEMTRWDDDSLRNGSEWARANLMVSYTTTDRAFDAVAVAALRRRYGSLARLNADWGVDFPAPTGGEGNQEEWGPLLAVVRETRSVPELTGALLEQTLGSLEKANQRWGSQTSWGARDRPTGFTSWAQVANFLKRFYRELSQVRTTDGWNVSPWCDFRNYMDATFAEAIARARAVCKEEDPHARCSTEGGQSPFAFGWYNYENVVKVIDVIEPYNIGNNVEVIRSLNPGVIMVSTHGFQHEPGKPLTEQDRLQQKRAIRPIWWGLFHGHRGALIWDDNLPDYRFVDEQNRQLTPAAATFSGLFHELRDGIGQLFINSRRLHDGIAIHYSQASMQIHWLLDNVQNACQWMLHSGGDRYSHFTGLRNSWTKLIEDLGLQYEFVGRGHIEEGKLGSGQYRVFIMPQSVAVSAVEANAIRKFVCAGGLLIADYRAASMNEHGRDLGHGQLDDVFGIRRAQSQARGQTAEGHSDAGSLHLSGKPLHVVVGDDTVGLTSGKPLARSGSVPLVIVNDFGKGKAVFLNLEISSYAYERLQPRSATCLPDLLEGILSLAGIEPGVRVLDSSGKRLPGTEIVRFGNGPFEHVAVFRNPQFDDGGWGDYPTEKAREWAGQIDNTFLEEPAEVTISWSSSMPTYDIRGRQDLGVIAKHEATLEPWSPLTFTRGRQPVPKYRIEFQEQIEAGAALAVTLRDESPLPEGAFRVIRLELLTPAGQLYDLYTQNVLIKSTPHTVVVPLALNDPPGRWVVRTRDVMTGNAVQRPFTVLG